MNASSIDGRRPAALISQMTPPVGQDAEFDSWYRDEHIPARMAIAGFSSAVRGWSVQGEPTHLAIYYLSSLDALDLPEYRQLKADPGPRTTRMLESVAAFTRWTAEEIADTGEAPPGKYLYLVTFAVPEAALAEFDSWYTEDHVPALMQADDWVRVRRYAPSQRGVPPEVTRIAVHELADVAVLGSPERASARASRWRARLAREPWFASARYAVYERFEEFEAQS